MKLYNSREWQNELDINFTAMDFRIYGNALGRFFGIDALSEQNLQFILLFLHVSEKFFEKLDDSS